MGSLADWNKSKSTVDDVSERQMDLIRQRNSLDIELYSFATKLFRRRMALVSKFDSPMDGIT